MQWFLREAWDYDAAGDITTLLAPNGGEQTWSYDGAGRITGTTWLTGTTSLFTQPVTLDGAGQRTASSDSWGSTTFGYDTAGRLTSASYPDGSPEADQYDAGGNRTVITGTTTLAGTNVITNTFDLADQLTGTASTQGNTTYSYDGNGNQTASYGITGVVTNTYNDLDQLTNVVGPGTNVSYVYDGQGDRLRSYEQSGTIPVLYNDAQDLAGGLSDLVSDGINDYTYLDPGAGEAPTAAYTTATSRTTYLATDVLGSVRLATDPTGAVIGAGAYDAWGVYQPNLGTSGATLLAGLQAVSPFGYAGQYYDAGAGTYDMRARKYNPAQGRFTSEDPQEYDPQVPITTNPYEYAGDMVTGTKDPSGRWSVAAYEQSQAGGGTEQQAENQIISNFYAFLPPPPASNTYGYNTQGQSNPTPQLGGGPVAAVPLDVVFDAPVLSAVACAHDLPPYLLANILSTHGNQVWDIERASDFKAQPNKIRQGVGNLVKALQQGGYYLPHVNSYNLPQGATSVRTVSTQACGTGVDLFDCNFNTSALDGPFPDVSMTAGSTSIDQWFLSSTPATADATPTPTPGEGSTGAHHVFESTAGSGTYEWWVQEPGIILWQSSGDVGGTGDSGHYTNPLLNTIDIVLGGSLSQGQQCGTVIGCSASVAWLAFNLDFAKQAGTQIARAGLLAARLGTAGLRTFVAHGGAIRLVDETGAQEVLRGQAASDVVDGLGCPAPQCFPAGTLVLTPRGEVPIDHLRIGDTVLAEDPKTGKVDSEPIQDVIVHTRAPLIALDLSDGSTIKVQPNHVFWVDGGPDLSGAGWLEAGQLRAGDRLRSESGVEILVRAIRWNVGDAKVYTLTVATDHTFFVGAAQILVHNSNIFSACQFLGGSYKALSGQWKKINGQIHHLIAANVLPKGLYDKGPSIVMTIKDHQLTESWGGHRSGYIYRTAQLAMLDRGDVLDALYRDVTGIRESFGSTYDVNIDEALTYTESAFTVPDLHALHWAGTQAEWANAVENMRIGLDLRVP